MSQLASKYSIEIFDPAGNRLVDLTGRAKQRRLSKSRNEADELSCTIDLDEFEAWCRQLNQDPASILTTGRNELRLKRGTTYLSGGQLTYWHARRTDRGKELDLRATGFFNLLASRYTSAEFLATSGTTIAWNLLDFSQQQPNGDFGITLGNMVAVGLWNKTFVRTKSKDAWQDLATSPSRGFDFEFLYNKVVNFYTSIGSDRSNEILFELPGNVIEWSVPNDATGIANEVIGIGQGNGDEGQTVYTGTASNSTIAAASQLTHGLRQKFLQRSASDNDSGSLTDQANAELQAWAFPFEVPQITVDGNRTPFITDYGIGDTVRVRLKDSDLVGHVDGAYRIEKYDLAIDENDDERVTLYLSV